MRKLGFKSVGAPALILFAICVVISGALALTNALTKDAIAANVKATENAAKRLVLSASDYVPLDYTAESGVQVWQALGSESDYAALLGAGSEASAVSGSDLALSDTDLSASDHSQAVVINDETAGVASVSDIAREELSVIGYVVKSSAKGYGGALDIMTGISRDGLVTGVTILSISETPGLGMKAKSESYLGQYIALSASDTLAVKKDGGELDALSGATITSRAVAAAVNSALRAFRIVTGREADPDALVPASASDLSQSDLSQSDISGTDLSPSSLSPSDMNENVSAADVKNNASVTPSDYDVTVISPEQSNGGDN